MGKCPKCGIEVESGMKFCGECGSPIPQTKKCPKCGLELPLATKFCGECGYNFNAASSGGGSVIGDKNVIAGDVHIDQSSTVTNNTVNNITNTVINQDETKKLVACAVCGKQLAIVDAIACKSCGKYVCSSHFHGESGKCSSCHGADETIYRQRLVDLIAGGVIGVKEDAELKALASSLHISNADAVNFLREVEATVGEACDVVIQINGSYLHVGREPVEKLEKLEFDVAASISANAPDKCYESIYAIDTVNSSITVSLDWTVGEVKRHIEPSWGANETGPRNIVFVEGEESFGVYDDCEATLYVTETTATEDDWNAARVTFKAAFKVYGEFKPSDVCVKYGSLGFDEDFKRLISVSYRGRQLPVVSETASKEDLDVARDSWIETKDKRYEYNVWAPKPCRLMLGEIRSKAVYVAVADFNSIGDAESAIASCCGNREQIKALVVNKAQNEDPQTCGLFLDASGTKMSVKRKCVRSQYDENAPTEVNVSPCFMVNGREEVFECEDSNDSDRYVNSGSALCISELSGGKARITYFEQGTGSVVFDFFCFDNFDLNKVVIYLQPSGAVSDSGSPQMLISKIGYSVPSYGKREKYIYTADEMNEEIDCSNAAVKLDSNSESAWCVIEGDGQVKIVQL